MKTLNKTISALAVATLLTVGGVSTAFAAQGQGGRADGPDLDAIFTELNITTEQQAQVTDILKGQRGNGERDNSGTRPTPEEHQVMMEERKAELESSLVSVLSADQAADLMAYLDANRPNGERPERK